MSPLLLISGLVVVGFLLALAKGHAEMKRIEAELRLRQIIREMGR
jgi:hypothetical protein